MGLPDKDSEEIGGPLPSFRTRDVDSHKFQTDENGLCMRCGYPAYKGNHESDEDQEPDIPHRPGCLSDNPAYDWVHGDQAKVVTYVEWVEQDLGKNQDEVIALLKETISLNNRIEEIAVERKKLRKQISKYKAEIERLKQEARL